MDLAGALIDGEIVAFAPDGRTDFSTLQKALTEGGPLDFFAFDLLEEAGEDLTGKPLIERKSRLQALLRRPAEGQPHPLQRPHPRRRRSGARSRSARPAMRASSPRRRSAPYRGERTKTWLKIKCSTAAGIRHRRLDAVRQAPAASTRCSSARGRTASSSITGRVGTGFDDRDLEELSARFEKLARKDLALRGGAARGARAPNGSSRSSSPRSPSRNSPPTAFCAIPPSSACARTRRRARCMLEKPEPVEEAMADDGDDIVSAPASASPARTRCSFPARGSPRATSSTITRRSPS